MEELKDTALRYSSAPLTIAGRQLLWTCGIFELLYQNEIYSTIARTTEQENVSLQAVFSFYCSRALAERLLSSSFQFTLYGGAQSDPSGFLTFVYTNEYLQNCSNEDLSFYD